MVAHDVLTYLSAKSIGFPDYKVEVSPYSYDKIDTQMYNPDYKLEYREGKSPAAYSRDPMYDETAYYSNFIEYNTPENGMVSGLEVLSLYSAEPDWGMDQNLNLSVLQKLMGESQGYRHMRYILFFFIRAGIVHKQVVYFNRLAKIAFDRGDKYWGLRFSARSIHYLEDLLTPVHSKPFDEIFLLKNIFSPKKIFLKSFNYHMNFEKLIGYYLWHNDKDLIEAINNAPAKNFNSLSSIYLRAKHYKIRFILKKIFNEMEKVWGEKMGKNIYKLKINEIEDRLFYEGLLKLSVEWLGLSASIIKGYIRNFIIPEL